MKILSQDKGLKLFEGIHFNRIEARNLQLKKRQKFYFKYADYQIVNFEKTEYYVFKVKESQINTKDGLFEGDCEISLPVIAFNKMISRMNKTHWLYQNANNTICVTFQKQSRHTYKGISLIQG